MTVNRIRIRYEKGRELRFLSHLEVARALDRALIRAGLPLAYTEGFKPRPKVSYATSLPVGAFGASEYLDISLVDMETDQAVAGLSAAMPNGMGIDSASPLLEGSKALQSLPSRQEWCIHLLPSTGSTPATGLMEALNHLRSLSELHVERKKGPAVVDSPADWMEVEGCTDSAANLVLQDPGQAAVLPGPPLRIQDVLAYLSAELRVPMTSFAPERHSIEVDSSVQKP